MKVANSEVTGIAGGFYGLFDRIGLRFFVALIGVVRAKRHELEYTRVTVGGTWLGFSFGVLVGLLAFFGTAGLSNNGIADASLWWVAAGAAVGALLFLILAGILVDFVRSLRDQDVSTAPTPPRDSSFDTIVAERRKKYLDSGYHAKDADREAWWFAKLSARRHGRW
jgi:hypothetical protein